MSCGDAQRTLGLGGMYHLTRVEKTRPEHGQHSVIRGEMGCGLGAPI